MPDVQALKCKTHGKECNGNPKHAHVFVWVKL
jgi:hypothetical protein